MDKRYLQSKLKGNAVPQGCLTSPASRAIMPPLDCQTPSHATANEEAASSYVTARLRLAESNPFLTRSQGRKHRKLDSYLTVNSFPGKEGGTFRVAGKYNIKIN